jgi:hypothetical protein
VNQRPALAWRLRRHGLAERPATGDPAALAGRLCGLHAQVMGSAELSVAARTEDLGRTAVADALWRDRTLVKMWAARGTLHLLPAAELGTWLGALGTLRKFGNHGNPDTERICRAVGPALRGRVLSRDELADEVGRSTGSARLADWVRSSWGSDLKAASFRGLLCFAAPTGGTIRFAGRSAWVLEDDLAEMRQAECAPAYRLLPAFDPWVIGMPRHEPFVRPDHLPEVFRPAGRIAPVVLAGGRIVGRWAHRTGPREVRLSIVGFEPIPRPGRAALTAEAERVARHLDRPLHLSWDGD